MPLNLKFRALFYAVFGVLFASGLLWLFVGVEDDPFHSAGQSDTAALLLKLHGGSAMLFLIFLGALIPLHIRNYWRNGRNRWAGAMMIAINTILIVTAYLLYYSGSDSVRAWGGELHIIGGLALPPAIALHVWLGRRKPDGTDV
jgi:hypothetical protein